MTTIKNSSTAGKDVMVGFDDDLRAIKEQLRGASSRRRFIPIVGMGGIGKTTLASNAYHCQLSREVFHIFGWVTVSQSYSLEDIHSRLYQSLEVENSESSKKVFKEDWGEQVYKALKGRKYLVVVDDIWSTEVLDSLNILLPDDNNGSRVIITTRLQELATYVKHSSPHEMQLMSEGQSWDLLRQKVLFINGAYDRELEDIGMAIARSCGGLPLAIVVIAGLLATVEQDRAAWEEIAEKARSTVGAKDGQFERILSLSYTHLPHRLRQCFVYMGGFTDDRQIHISRLIKLWIAEGFIDATTASKCLEEEAVDYLQDLIKRSLVLVGKRNSHGEIKSCSLHDLMRDLCIRKTDEEKFPIHKEKQGATLLETFKVVSEKDVQNFRVVDVGRDVLNPWPIGPDLYPWIPEQTFRLSNLRYLALAYFAEIPAAMSQLENLQTFIVYPMESLVRLPREVWTMPQLRHLVSSFDPLPDPEGEATPINLQTLWEVNNLEFTDTFVKMIPNIKKLGLLYSQRYELQGEYFLGYFSSLHQFGDLLDHCDYHLENLANLHQLEKLNMSDHYDYHLENLANLHQLEKLNMCVYPGFQGILNPVFPRSLKNLSLNGWRLPSWNDMKIIGSLPNLQVLKLKDSGGQDERWETAEGEFTQLSFLLMEGSDLREWITEWEHFPKLKKLLLHRCWFLEEIPAGIGDIPTLELIEVMGASTLLVKSAKKIEEEQKEFGNDRLKVSCI